MPVCASQSLQQDGAEILIFVPALVAVLLAAARGRHPPPPPAFQLEPGACAGVKTREVWTDRTGTAHWNYRIKVVPWTAFGRLTLTLHGNGMAVEAVYGGPKPSPDRFTLRRLMRKYAKGERISVVTAYDYPSAVAVDQAGIDVCLVGDSAAMVVHGHDTTLPITLDEMLSHCRAVARGASRPLLVGDLPFGSYEQSPGHAVQSATRLLKEGGMDAVKLEGGSPARVDLSLIHI